MHEALANNPDLRVAAARVEQAAALRQGRRRHALSAGQRCWRAAAAQLSGDSSGLQGVGIFANWELDLWGRVRAGRAVGARRSTTRRALDAEYARQSLAALVAKSWFLATEARLQKANAEEMAAASERQLGFAQDRLRVGSGDEYDVALARANLATFRDSVRSLDLAYRQSLRALEALAGRYPGRGARACRRSSRRCPGRCRSACRRSCSSAAPTWSPPSGASPPRSTASRRRRPRACRASRSPRR